ncbi:putative molybdenum carrier protein [Maridesulfovibrio sp.]|uniref:putative molybdenum carrier protein n=1 Tax=Maridesulfovibrio sp. TaxID=2795000 RepID=UPI002A188BDA|nr:putative molybdenum carrier protein [Maridesulfovibrio sp.]
MEDAARYGVGRFRSCEKCMWTGPLDTFEVIPALISSMDVVRCPNCGSTQDCRERVFAQADTLLPEGFTIVSGGQTGVDRGALDAAIALGIPHRGWCPAGRKAEDGVIPACYNMQEMDDPHYWKRTGQNVLDSDGTLVFPGNCKSKGTELTIRLAKQHGRPVAVVDPDSGCAAETVAAWIGAAKIRVLNVAGPRESGCPGISARTRKFLISLFSEMKKEGCD